jgi:methionine synthase I (cobalamin-dependent)
MSKLISWLRDRGVLVADGATGTMLQEQGLAAGTAPERWNLENREAVSALYRRYAEAGSDLILTNTFGGSSVRLKREGLAERVVEINRAAAELAVEAAGDGALAVGDIGPTGEMMAPLGLLAYEDAVATFAQQAQGLAAGGVHAFLIETMSDLSEMQAAVEGVRRVSDLPILATMSFDTKGRTMMGVKPETAATALQSFGVDVMGANCGRTLTETLEAVIKMRQAVPDALLMAKPNAGLPRADGQNLIYDVTPEVMAEYALRFVQEAGISIFGGCCGSRPEHIHAIAKALKPDQA